MCGEEGTGKGGAAAFTIAESREMREPEIRLGQTDARECEGDAVPGEVCVLGDVVDEDAGRGRRVWWAREIEDGRRGAFGEMGAEGAEKCGLAAATGTGEEDERGVRAKGASGIDACEERLSVGEGSGVFGQGASDCA